MKKTIETSIYQLINAVQEVVGKEEEHLVPVVVASMINSGHAKTAYTKLTLPQNRQLTL